MKSNVVSLAKYQRERDRRVKRELRTKEIAAKALWIKDLTRITIVEVHAGPRGRRIAIDGRLLTEDQSQVISNYLDCVHIAALRRRG